ncbi:hypothetical protein CYMTET_26789 [Cymbomonas tetramitiformis]|uniref:Major facilitator superfamily (MFS) profile domain-containing protein n=1 Tax=Cymbomonas tetramitiformis TaxID=36881 RepID=A0AAE0FRD9_9CHLO|nr:hypothetical protein CYMTET_26789 [Cymbomonas tetramitiformis]
MLFGRWLPDVMPPCGGEMRGFLKGATCRDAAFALAGKLFISAVFDAIYVYSAEVFSTEIRGSAVGLCSAAARMGAMLAPQVLVLLGLASMYAVFGLVAILASITCWAALPETAGQPLPDHARDAKTSSSSSNVCDYDGGNM